MRPRIGDEGMTMTTRARRGQNSGCGLVRIQTLKPGEALAVVVESHVEGFPLGDLVHHDLGYRGYALLDPGNQALSVAGALSKLDRELGPPELLVALPGMTSLTVWAGMLVVASLKLDGVVWISAAASAVGSVAAQLAKAHGYRVIGSAGREEGRLPEGRARARCGVQLA